MRGLASHLAIAIAIALSLAPAAHAQVATGNDKVAAEALFEEGRKLVTEGKYGDACPKFADSQRLDPSPGTLLNLASCWEKDGRLATAWATYREAASVADAVGRKDYRVTAERHADGLAPRLARLTLNLAQPTDGMQVKRDGVIVERAEWGVPIPVDTGSHAVEAAAPGHKGWASTVDVPQDGAQTTLTVPALEVLPVEAPTVAPPASVAPPAPSAVAPPAGGSETAGPPGRPQRTIGIVVAGLGLVGVGIGAAFAISAQNQYDTSVNNCTAQNHDLCSATGVAQRNDARSAGNAATAALGIGAAALVAGGVLFFTAPSGPASGSSAARIVVVPTIGGAMLKGDW